MEKRRLVLAAAALSLLLTAAGCGTADGSLQQQTSGGSSLQQGESSQAQKLCRIVTGAEDGSLLLAGQDGDSGVYRLTVGSTPVSRDGQPADAGELEDGMLVEVTFDGSVLETFPAQLSGVSGINMTGLKDDLCSLYLEVLDDLWEVDSGLNEGITELGVDLSGTRLNAAEQAAVAWAFGERHAIVPVQGTYEELIEQGYITSDPIGDSDSLAYQWRKGCLFSITEQRVEGIYSLEVVNFDAQKWRSGLGAYFYSDCTSVRSARGEWAAYTVGSEAIS